MQKTRVMIVDDQLMSRRLFQMYLKDSEKYEVVHVIESAAFADAFVLRSPVDLVLMDILMSDGSNGLDAAARIKKDCPNIRIIAVTSMPEASWLARAREIGIDSFWYKEVEQDTILDVIDRTMAGESVYPDRPPKVELGPLNHADFTQRELDVLRIMVTGASNSEIAKKLYLSEGTVKFYIHNMLEKTGCKSRTELAIEARVSGIAINLD
ncbi:response regulator transcription factor [Allobaculum mucilyticum]|uniref:response regulator transcription factor n=1 Tax=Allobaculum mucilyticum TaxID=2834459 RepID=UPI001E60BC9C|nr:response regulator transcription factor [Allobaculum mucilyticum]UNT96209.1 response regulator transcription factor [Allobaculum mucilyticum]